jgi:predicted PurR-regulated permease PerM
MAIIAAHLWQPVTNLTRRYLPKFSIGAVNVLLFLIVIVLPLTLILGIVAREIYEIIRELNFAFDSSSLDILLEEINNFLANLPVPVDPIEIGQVRDQLVGFLRQLPGILLPASNYLLALVTNFILFLIIFSGINLKYDEFIEYVKSVSPLSSEKTDEFLTGIWDTARQVLISTFVIGLIQASITFLALVILQVEYALLWSVLTLVAAVLPIGAGFILFPLGLVMLVTGETLKAVVLLSLGFLLVNVVDNLLRPKLAANEDSLPESLMLIGILGGIALFGLMGIFIGPIILIIVKQTFELVRD